MEGQDTNSHLCLCRVLRLNGGTGLPLKMRNAQASKSKSSVDAEPTGREGLLCYTIFSKELEHAHILVICGGSQNQSPVDTKGHDCTDKTRKESSFFLPHNPLFPESQVMA